jgi:hypothetical protein
VREKDLPSLDTGKFALCSLISPTILVPFFSRLLNSLTLSLNINIKTFGTGYLCFIIIKCHICLDSKNVCDLIIKKVLVPCEKKMKAFLMEIFKILIFLCCLINASVGLGLGAQCIMIHANSEDSQSDEFLFFFT